MAQPKDLEKADLSKDLEDALCKIQCPRLKIEMGMRSELELQRLATVATRSPARQRRSERRSDSPSSVCNRGSIVHPRPRWPLDPLETPDPGAVGYPVRRWGPLAPTTARDPLITHPGSVAPLHTRWTQHPARSCNSCNRHPPCLISTGRWPECRRPEPGESARYDA